MRLPALQCTTSSPEDVVVPVCNDAKGDHFKQRLMKCPFDDSLFKPPVMVKCKAIVLVFQRRAIVGNKSKFRLVQDVRFTFQYRHDERDQAKDAWFLERPRYRDAYATIYPDVMESRHRLCVDDHRAASIIVTRGLHVHLRLIGTVRRVQFFGRLRLEDTIRGRTRRVGVVVQPFHAVGSQTALRNCASAVYLRFVVNFRHAELRVRVGNCFVSFFPATICTRVAILRFALCQFSVCFRYVTRALSVQVDMRIAKGCLVARPSQGASFRYGLSNVILISASDSVAIPEVVDDLLREGDLTLCLRIQDVKRRRVGVRILAFRHVRVSQRKEGRAASVKQAANATRPELTLILPSTFRQVEVRRPTAVRKRTQGGAVVWDAFRRVVVFYLAVGRRRTMISVRVASDHTDLTVD